MSIYQPAPADSKGWSTGWSAIAQSHLWWFLVLAIGSSSSIVYAHAPLVAFAASTGATLTRRKAVLVALAIWLVNQIYGYTLRQYPLAPNSLAWGLLMGVGTLLVTWLAALRPKFSQTHWIGHLLWLVGAAVGGFVLFEGIILLALPLLTEGHSLGWDILLKLFVKEMIWTGAIALCHSLLVRLAMQRSTQRLSPALLQSHKSSHLH